ncbi:MAG TPA: cation diffusion facilitator family transporter [Rhodoferax sp.]
MTSEHTHSHAHDHSHSHAPAEFNQAFAIGIVLNTVFVVIEGFYGWKINSLALLADAGHNLSDVAGLLLAWGGVLAGQRRPDSRYTYGFKRASILAAFINAVVLLLAMGSLGWEALGRLQHPEATQGATIIAVAGVGIVINSATALMFMRGSQGDLNIRGAYLHMAADALVSLGVVLGGALYLWQGWAWIDPVMSLAIAVVIVLGTWSLLRQSVHLLFDGVPDSVDLAAVRRLLLALPGVADVHDLHVWAMGTSDIALTAHLVLTQQVTDMNALLHEAEHELHEHFEIRHATLQLESSNYALQCAQRSGAFCQ